MNRIKFTELCFETAQILHLTDAENFSDGEVVTVDDIDIQFIQDEKNSNLARLFLELGELNEVDKVEVYESLFSIQLMMEGEVDGQFVLDNLNDRMMFVVRLPLSDQTEASQLASVINLFVQQVMQWRSTILAGYLFEDEFNEQDINQASALQRQATQIVTSLA